MPPDSDGTKSPMLAAAGEGEVRGGDLIRAEGHEVRRLPHNASGRVRPRAAFGAVLSSDDPGWGNWS